MQITNIGGKNLLLDDISSILVKCSSETGYFTDNGGDFKATSLSMILLKSEMAKLTIEPYFIQRDFQILYGIIIDSAYVESVGAHEISCIKFVGESETNFTNLSNNVRRKAIKAALAKPNGIIGEELNTIFKSHAVKLSMYPAINKAGNRYNSVSFELTPLPEDYLEFASELFLPKYQKLVKEPQAISLARWLASTTAGSSPSPSPSSSSKTKPQFPSNSIDIF